VVKLIAAGLSNTENRNPLVVSAVTFKTHVNDIFQRSAPGSGPKPSATPANTDSPGRNVAAPCSELARWMFAAGIAAGITSLFQAAIGETMTYRAAHGASPASVRTLFDVGTASLLGRRTCAFPH
jgi:hypothetical protein